MKASGTPLVRWGVLAAPVVLMTACSTGTVDVQVSDEQATSASPSGTTTRTAPPGVETPAEKLVAPSGNAVVAGKINWSISTGLPEQNGKAITTSGKFWMAAGVLTNTPATTRVILGAIRDGKESGRKDLANTSGWPALALIDGRPNYVIAHGASDSDGFGRVVMYGADGKAVWTVSGVELGQTTGGDAGTGLFVDSVDGNRAVVRATGADRGRGRDARISVLNTSNGEVVWQSDPEPLLRGAVTGNGQLLVGLRKDGAAEEPSDAVRAIRLADGAQLWQYDIVNEAPVIQVCGYILDNGTAVVCGIRAEEDDAGTTVWRGRVAGVSSTGAELWAVDGTYGSPAFDERTGTVSVRDKDNRLRGLNARDGKELWSWTADRTTAAQIKVGAGYGGWFVGGAGTDAVALTARTGEVAIVEDFFALSPAQLWGRSTCLQYKGDQLRAVTGPGSPVGLSMTSDAEILYVDSGKNS